MREKQIMTVEEAVRKLTFMVASIFGLPDRGLLRRGMAADLCVFDPATVRECDAEMVQDLPGNEKRFIQKAVGIEMTTIIDLTGPAPLLVRQGLGDVSHVAELR